MLAMQPSEISMTYKQVKARFQTFWTEKGGSDLYSSIYSNAAFYFIEKLRYFFTETPFLL